MKLKKIAVSGDTIYDVPTDFSRRASVVDQNDLSTYSLLLEAISVCHGVKPVKVDTQNGEIIDFQGSSPDEVALIQSLSSSFDRTLEENKNNRMHIKSQFKYGLNKKYQTLYTFPFSSETARMGSLILDLDTNEVTFIIKGSDSAILPFLKYEYERKEVDTLTTQLAKDGLRTLVYA